MNIDKERALLVALIVLSLLGTAASTLSVLQVILTTNSRISWWLNVLFLIILIISIASTFYTLWARYVVTGKRRKRIKLNTKAKYPRLSIVGIMGTKKSDETTLGMSLLLLTVFAETVLSKLFNQTPDTIVCIILVSMSILLFIRKIAFDYRVKNGLYGTNESEAREIIAFIIKESEKIDFTDGGKRKNIIGDEDLAEIKERIKELIPSTTYTV